MQCSNTQKKIIKRNDVKTNIIDKLQLSISYFPTQKPPFQMKDKLRSPAQGADTAVWLAVAASVREKPNGKFFQDRVVVNEHLPLACTRSSAEEEAKLMDVLQGFSQGYQQ